MDAASSTSAFPSDSLSVGAAGIALPSNGPVLLRDFGWQKYQGLLAVAGEKRLPHTYVGGTVEIMSPSQKHEWESELLCLLVQQTAIVLDREFLSLGSWTLSREDLDQGLEPDNCFYLANEPAVRFREHIDLAKDPPPDLAIEIDVTSSSLPRMPVYASLGVPEVWRYDGESLQINLLADGQYRGSDSSAAFPFLPAAKLTELLAARATTTELQLVKQFTAWVREHAGD